LELVKANAPTIGTLANMERCSLETACGVKGGGARPSGRRHRENSCAAVYENGGFDVTY
jgi:hypothetical protein